MTLLNNQSRAFRQALLRSERLRIMILLCVLAAVLLIRIIRTAIAWNPENASGLLWIGLFSIGLALYELFVLRAIRVAIQNGQDLSHYSWLFNILVESCIPGLIIAFMSSSSTSLEFRAVTNPLFQSLFSADHSFHSAPQPSGEQALRHLCCRELPCGSVLSRLAAGLDAGKSFAIRPTKNRCPVRRQLGYMRGSRGGRSA